jgi:hypothetical protein
MARNEDGLSSANRDFSARWHLTTVVIVAGVLFLIYIVAKKLIFG